MSVCLRLLDGLTELNLIGFNMPDIYNIVNDIRKAFIDESVLKDTLMYNIWFEWSDIVAY